MAPGAGTDVKGFLIGRVGGPLLTELMKSVRSELVSGAEVETEVMMTRRPAIYVIWHGRLLPGAFHYREQRLATLISRNRDGDHIAGVVESWGFRVIRGSSSRGGAAALRQIVQTLEEGTSVALTPDGPRGPRQQMKLGPLQAARLAGVPLVPATAGAVRAAYFGRWDRFLVPAPFTWVPVALGEPMWVPSDVADDQLEGYRALLEERLNALTDLVDRTAREGRR
jgi:lysophospholipid acyltransferase (LPLAT)-like uncharacterized protein